MHPPDASGAKQDELILQSGRQGFGLWDALGVEVAEMAQVFGWIGRMCIS